MICAQCAKSWRVEAGPPPPRGQRVGVYGVCRRSGSSLIGRAPTGGEPQRKQRRRDRAAAYNLLEKIKARSVAGLMGGGAVAQMNKAEVS